MIVTCKVVNCPYVYQGFCSKRQINIEPSGGCDFLFGRDQHIFSQADQELPVIIDAEIEQDEQTTEKEETEGSTGSMEK